MTNILKKNNKIKQEVKIKRKYKSKTINTDNNDLNENIKGGGEHPDIGPFEPVILKNETHQDKMKLFEKDKADLSTYQQNFDNNFREFQTEQQRLINNKKDDLEKELHKNREANKQQRHKDIREEKAHEQEKKDAKGKIYFVYKWLSYILLSFIFLIRYIFEGILRFIKYGISKFGSIFGYFTTRTENAGTAMGKIIGFFKNLFLALGRGLYSVGKTFASYLGSFAAYCGNKTSGAINATQEFIARAANGPVVVVIMKYVLLILFIMLILGIGLSLFGIKSPSIPSLGNYNPFGDYGYGMFKDKFDYYIGNPLRKGLNIASGDLSGYGYDPLIGGGGIADLLAFNPSMGKIPTFDKNEDWTMLNFPWKALDLIIPKGLFNDMMINYRSINNKMSKIFTGKDPVLLESINRPYYENTDGRCDNIYNIDLDTALKSSNSRGKLAIIENYDNNINDNNKKVFKDLEIPSSNNKQVFSIGKPKDITIELNPTKYINLDYNNLPDSIKNHKFDNDTLTLKDKLKITIPYIEVAGVYKLSFNDAYYTNDKNKTPIRPSNNLTNIFTDDSVNYLRANVNEININENGNIYNQPLYTIND